MNYYRRIAVEESRVPSRPAKKTALIDTPANVSTRSNVLHPTSNFTAEHRVGTALRETYYGFCRSMSAVLSRQGITLSMWFVLRELWNQDGLSQGVIAKRTGTSAPSIVSIVKALEREGLVRRTTSEADRRVSFIFLTREGKLLEARLTRAVLPMDAEALSGFSKSEINMLLSMLSRLRANTARLVEDK